mgnify:CR=1 FL=1
MILSKQSGAAEVLEHALKVDFWDVAEMAFGDDKVRKGIPFYGYGSDAEPGGLRWRAISGATPVTEDTTGLLVLPLARVRRDGSGHFVYDPDFIPPSLQIGAGSSLPALLGGERTAAGVVDMARMLVVVAVHAQQLPVAAVGRIEIVVVVAVVHGEFLHVGAGELARTAAADPRVHLQRALAIALVALLGVAITECVAMLARHETILPQRARPADPPTS